MRRNRAAVALAAAVGAVGLLLPGASSAWAASSMSSSPSSPSAQTPTEVRARRSELVARIAEATDRATAAQADVINVQFEQLRLADLAAAVHQRVLAHAVAAYVHGPDASAELAAPGPYLDVTARKERELLARYRQAKTEVAAHQAAADAAESVFATANAQAAQARGELAALDAAEDARILAARQAAERQAEQEAADAARRRVLADQALAEAQALARSRSGDPGGGGSAAGSAGETAAQAARHAAATKAQAALMAKYPFGVLPPGPLPSGLVPTGTAQSGLASWYGGDFNGQPTATGAIYDEDGWTAASLTLPLGTMIVVSRNGVRVLLLVNDRGPYIDGRILDLSAAAARALGGGVSPVDIQVVAPARP
jgi:rare lipoprotein A (peptidoglycan hydrolase)